MFKVKVLAVGVAAALGMRNATDQENAMQQRKTMWWAMMGAIAVLGAPVASGATADPGAVDFAYAADVAADPLLAVERNRPGIIARLVAEHRNALAASGINESAFRNALAALRADQLLAASLVNTLQEVTSIVAAPAAEGSALARYVAVAPTSTLAALPTADAYLVRDDVALRVVPASELQLTRDTQLVGYFIGVNGGGASSNASRAGFSPKDGPGSGPNSWIGYTAGNNVASGLGSAVAAGTFNAASAQNAFVGAGQSNVASGISSLVIGGFDNRATAIDSLVAAGAGNRATGARSVVIGGGYNLASGQWSFVGGGGRQTANAAVAGGFVEDNIASGNFSVVTGGQGNRASAIGATVGGGVFNVASGNQATVPGGSNNLASGSTSFAAGNRAKTQTAGGSPVIHNGTFAFADGRNFDFHTAADNEFAVRATGGIRFVTEVNGSGVATQSISADSRGMSINGPGWDSSVELWVRTGDFTGPFANLLLEARLASATRREGILISAGGDSSETNSQGFYLDQFDNINGQIRRMALTGIGTGRFGGTDNNAAADNSVIIGGLLNISAGRSSVVAGGENNETLGKNSFAIGAFNCAGGERSFAGGHFAWVRPPSGSTKQGACFPVGDSGDANGDEGTFIWNGGGNTALESTGPNQFLVRANGGVALNGPPVQDVELTINGKDGYGNVYLRQQAQDATTGGYLISVGDAFVGSNNARLFFDQYNPSLVGNRRLMLDYHGGLGLNRGDALVGGVGFPLVVGTNGTNGNGAHLTQGGAWTNGSSREFKEDFASIDTTNVLSHVLAMPITTWRYKNSQDGRHMGPIAEDFAAAFGLGGGNQYIGTVDGFGVALAAIQGLNAKLEAANAAMLTNEQTANAALAAKEARIADLENRVSELGMLRGERSAMRATLMEIQSGRQRIASSR